MISLRRNEVGRDGILLFLSPAFVRCSIEVIAGLQSRCHCTSWSCNPNASDVSERYPGQAGERPSFLRAGRVWVAIEAKAAACYTLWLAENQASKRVDVVVFCFVFPVPDRNLIANQKILRFDGGRSWTVFFRLHKDIHTKIQCVTNF